jgi:hypothetical protein
MYTWYTVLVPEREWVSVMSLLPRVNAIDEAAPDVRVPELLPFAQPTVPDVKVAVREVEVTLVATNVASKS